MESDFNYISGLKNPKKEDFNKKVTMINPGHNIRECIKSINVGVKDLIDENKNIDKYIDVIQMPFKEFDSKSNGYEKIEFIDLRYLSVDEFPNIEDIFKYWKKVL